MVLEPQNDLGSPLTSLRLDIVLALASCPRGKVTPLQGGVPVSPPPLIVPKSFAISEFLDHFSVVGDWEGKCLSVAGLFCF